ncbi:MAG: SusC/RagA family TonB-linked outer membrane protein [Ferruginibacter sp.]|nr:SusC/RagA family TonB-linked outer membrane protein [Ferruginibacter sp.]
MKITAKSFLLFFMLGTFCMGSVKAQYSGSLLNEQKSPVAGATIKVAGSNTSTRTAPNGMFTINAASGDHLIITYPGYKGLRVVLSETKILSLSLEKDNSILTIGYDQPVQLIYSTAPSHLTVASNDAVYTNDLLKSPVTSFRNALSGRLAGLYTLQSSGLPGGDGAAFSLRGQSPVVIIDGVVANITQFDLEEIESITVLKDALGTAMLGVRGAQGAILVTTRKGKANKQLLSFTAQTALQKPIGVPKTLGSYDYARLYNEALLNDGLAPLYTDADLQAYKNHTDPEKYPDVNWRDQVLRKSSRFDKYTLSATGGNQFARYFVSLEHVNQTGLFKTVDSNNYNTNNNFKAYVIRSNVDITINSKLTGGIYLLGRILNGNEPGVTTGSILSNLLSTPNNAYPVLNDNGTFGGTQQFQNNIWAQAIGSGYRQNYKRDMIVNLYLRRSMDEIAKGLYVQARIGYYATLSENIFRTKSFAVFQKTTSGTGTINYAQFGTNGTQGNSNGIDYTGKSDYQEFKIGYDKTIDNTHGINAQLLVNRDNSVGGSDLPYTISGGSGKISYNYKERYTAEAAFGYNGSNRYPDKGDTKRGFFPAAGIGWNIEKESFMKGFQWLTRLKIFSSYGKSGWDNPGYFTYIQRFFDGATAYFGTGATGNTSMSQLTFANPNISWEKANKLNIGLNGAVLNNQLSFSIEYYTNKYYDLLQQRGSNSSLIGNFYPDENIGQNRYSGWEAQIAWNQAKSSFQYFIAANISIQKSKVLFADEVYRPFEWMKRTGELVGRRFGYTADGLFQTQAEINSSATTVGYAAQPGDIKYKDLNNDMVINEFDIAPIGTDKPFILFGVTVGAQWKGFDFSALIQGVQNRDIYLGGASYWAFQSGGFGQAYEDNLARWTPANAAKATYPRLNIGSNSNNQAFSSYWLAPGNYIRLKNIELGYSLPGTLVNKVKLQSARLFVNGFNLLTGSSAALGNRDPEVTSAFSYPIQKLTNIGVNIKF